MNNRKRIRKIMNYSFDVVDLMRVWPTNNALFWDCVKFYCFDDGWIVGLHKEDGLVELQKPDVEKALKLKGN